jgi:hypothetical protein
MFIKKTDFEGNTFWKRFEDKYLLEDLDKLKVIEKIEKPFLQLEFCLKTDIESRPVEKTEIHTEMQGFYIKGNKILDKFFIQWYIDKFYGLITNDNYEIQIIDTNVNLFKLTSNQECILEKQDDKPYIIKQNEN